MKAVQKNYRSSTKKTNLVAQLVRGMRAQEAVEVLRFTPKKPAYVLRKLISSAMANAEENNKQNPEDLVVKEIIVTEGPTMKRHVPVSRGRAHKIRKRTCHITVKLENRPATKTTPAKTTKPNTKETNTKK